MSFITFFATVPVRIYEVLVRPHLCLLAVCESGNIDLKSLDIWSAVASGRLCSTKNPEKTTSALIACFCKCFAEDGVQFVNFFCPFMASQYSLCFGVAAICFFHIFPTMANAKIGTAKLTKGKSVSFTRLFNKGVFVAPLCIEIYKILLFLFRSRSSAAFRHFVIVYLWFTGMT